MQTNLHSYNSILKELNQFLDFINQYQDKLVRNCQILLKQVQDKIEAVNILSSETQSASFQKNQNELHNQIFLYLEKHLDEFQQELNNIALSYVLWVKIRTFSQSNYAILDTQQQITLIQKNKQKINISKKILSTIKEQNTCRAFTFYEKQNIIIAALGNQIVAYHFDNLQMKQLGQNKSVDNFKINSLYFLQHSNLLISASQGNILVWCFTKNNELELIQELYHDKKSVNCVLSNEQEDLLISAGDDQTIKFWKNVGGQWNCFQQIEANQNLYDISMNEEENRLITCGEDPVILILEKQIDNNWKIIQMIQVEENGYRLCYLFQDQFSFQPKSKDYLEIFTYDTMKEQYQKHQKIEIQRCDDCLKGFSCQILKSLRLLAVKHGEFLNIFKQNESNNFELLQSFEFRQFWLFGRISKNWEYLVTWDYGSKEIQWHKLIMEIE